jgi:glycine cleavage system H protein
MNKKEHTLLSMPRFTPSHEWIHIEDEIATVGITAYAKQELGEIVYVELPKLGKKVKIGEEVVVLESTKAAADIYTPISGLIVAVNENLKSDVNLINTSPEQEGWLFKITMDKPEEVNTYLSKSDYTRQVT